VFDVVSVATAAVRVTERHDHTVASCKLSTALVATWPQSTSCAVSVTGFARGTPAEPILWFFENQKRSGGGPVMELYYDEQESSAVVTFHDRQGEFLVCFFKCISHFTGFFVIFRSSVAVSIKSVVASVSASGQSCFLFHAIELVGGHATGSVIHCRTRVTFLVKRHCHYPWPILISHPADGRRQSVPRWLIAF